MEREEDEGNNTIYVRNTPALSELAIQVMLYSSKPLDKIIASSVGGSLTAIVVTPFDVVKARLQAQVNLKGDRVLLPSQFSGTLDAVAKIAQKEGVHNLWRGLSTTLVMTVPATAFYFTTYEMIKEKMEYSTKFNPFVIPAIAGLTARVMTVVLSSPIELVRTHLQATSATQVANRGLVTTLQTVVQSGGYLSLWSGLSPTLWRDVPFSAVYWSSYEFWKSKLLPVFGKDRKFAVDFVSGALSGMLAATFSHPFDVIKTRRQMHIPTPDQKSKSTLQMLQTIAQEEGIGGLTKGMLPRVVKIVPACAIMISSYEFCKKHLHLK